MKLTIDTSASTMRVESVETSTEFGLYTQEAFAVISDLWIKAGWQLKYPYLFSWMGRPIIQLPEDLVAVQELIYRDRPDVIIETGIAHGGSLIFYASLCELLGQGQVVGIDIEIRPHNRVAIETHEMFKRITLLEGSSTDRSILELVKETVGPGDSVLVVLDSNHSKAHVLAELEMYAPLVTSGSYIIATDGVMELVHDVPRASPMWLNDNPKAAAAEFLEEHPEFLLDDPVPVFDEAADIQRATHWRGAYLRRR